MLRKPAYGRLFFCETPSGTETGGGNPPAATTPPATTPPTATPPSTEGSGPVAFTAEQQAEINRIVGQARKEGRTAAEQAAAQAEQDRQAEAAREAEKAKGNFAKVEADLTAERDGFKTERDAIQTDLDAAYKLLEAQATDLKGELPAELLAGFPETGSPVERITWLKERKSVFDVAKAATGGQGNGHPRVPPTPPPGGPVKPDIRDNLRSSGIRYT